MYFLKPIAETARQSPKDRIVADGRRPPRIVVVNMHQE